MCYVDNMVPQKRQNTSWNPAKCWLWSIVALTLAAPAAADTGASAPPELDRFPVLEGPYLGQKPPGKTPEIFAPDIISFKNRYEGGATFSRDGRFFCYKKRYEINPDVEKIWICEYKNEKWTSPELAPFCSAPQYSDWDFQFSSCEDKLYFTSSKPAIAGNDTLRPSNIWVVDYINDDWSEAIPMDYPVNTNNSYSGYPSVSKSGAIYFHSHRDDTIGGTDIYRVRYNNGQSIIENLGVPVNSAERDLDPCISPDESFLLFLSARVKNREYSNHLFVSFRNESNRWTDPIDLDPLIGVAALPVISPDGKYLFYANGDYSQIGTFDIYWVDIGLILDLKPAEINRSRDR